MRRSPRWLGSYVGSRSVPIVIGLLLDIDHDYSSFPCSNHIRAISTNTPPPRTGIVVILSAIAIYTIPFNRRIIIRSSLSMPRQYHIPSSHRHRLLLLYPPRTRIGGMCMVKRSKRRNFSRSSVTISIVSPHPISVALGLMIIAWIISVTAWTLTTTANRRI